MPTLQQSAASSPVVPVSAAPPVSGVVYELSPDAAALVLQSIDALIFDTGLGYEDDSLKDRLRVETSTPDYPAIAEFAHDLRRYTRPIPLLNGSPPKIVADAGTLGLLAEIEADIAQEAEPGNTFNIADRENHARRLTRVREIKAFVAASCEPFALNFVEREVLRTGVFELLYAARPDFDRPLGDLVPYAAKLAVSVAEQQRVSELLTAVEQGVVPVTMGDVAVRALEAAQTWLEGAVAASDSDVDADQRVQYDGQLADAVALLVRLSGGESTGDAR
jgi:hypothetical protein